MALQAGSPGQLVAVGIGELLLVALVAAVLALAAVVGVWVVGRRSRRSADCRMRPCSFRN